MSPEQRESWPWAVFRAYLAKYWALVAASTPWDHPDHTEFLQFLLDDPDIPQLDPPSATGVGFSRKKQALWVARFKDDAISLRTRAAARGVKTPALLESSSKFRTEFRYDTRRTYTGSPARFLEMLGPTGELHGRFSRLTSDDLRIYCPGLKRTSRMARALGREGFELRGFLFTGPSALDPKGGPFWFAIAGSRPAFLQPYPPPAPPARHKKNYRARSTDHAAGQAAPAPSHHVRPDAPAGPSGDDSIAPATHEPLPPFILGSPVAADILTLLGTFAEHGMRQVPRAYLVHCLLAWGGHDHRHVLTAIALLRDGGVIDEDSRPLDELGLLDPQNAETRTTLSVAPRFSVAAAKLSLSGYPNDWIAEKLARWAASDDCRLPRSVRLQLVLTPLPHVGHDDVSKHLEIAARILRFLPERPEDFPPRPGAGTTPAPLAQRFFWSLSIATSHPDSARVALELLSQYQELVPDHSHGTLAWKCLAARGAQDGTALVRTLRDLVIALPTTGETPVAPSVSLAEAGGYLNLDTLLSASVSLEPNGTTALAIRRMASAEPFPILRLLVAVLPATFAADVRQHLAVINAREDLTPQQRVDLADVLRAAMG